MKNLSILRVLSACVILCASIAFSCQDHEVPENPEQPLNCTLLDGTTRPFACEFKIVKVDFLRERTETVLATATPDDTTTTIGIPHYRGYDRTTGSGGYTTVIYRMKVTIERIANPSFESPGGYDFYLTSTPFRDEPGTPRFEQINPKPVNIKIGETFSFYHFALFAFFPSLQLVELPEFLTINNIATAEMLSKPPYNYLFRRDRAEAYMRLNVTLTR